MSLSPTGTEADDATLSLALHVLALKDKCPTLKKRCKPCHEFASKCHKCIYLKNALKYTAGAKEREQKRIARKAVHYSVEGFLGILHAACGLRGDEWFGTTEKKKATCKQCGKKIAELETKNREDKK